LGIETVEEYYYLTQFCDQLNTITAITYDVDMKLISYILRNVELSSPLAETLIRRNTTDMREVKTNLSISLYQPSLDETNSFTCIHALIWDQVNQWVLQTGVEGHPFYILWKKAI
jgi:hypothetical protein